MLFGFLPVFSSIRTPGRFNLVIGLGVAVLAAYGVAWLLEQVRGASWPRRVARYALVFGLMVAIVFDYQLVWDGFRPTFPTISAEIPDEIAALREDDSINVVMNMPYVSFYTKEALYLQTAHQKPLIAGYIARTTPVNTAKLDVLQSTLDPALFSAAGADAVILFREWSEDVNEHVYAGLGEPFYENERLAVFRVPQTDDAPGFMSCRMLRM